MSYMREMQWEGASMSGAPIKKFEKKELGPISRATPFENSNRFIESRSEIVREFARRESVLHNRFWPKLSEENETQQRVKKIVENILKQSGLPEDFLALEIFDSKLPDVHVQMLERKVRMSRTFLEIVEGDSYKITAVLAHEIGHVLLSHFDAQEKESFDPLNERIQGYEHEYQADRASVILTNRLGIPPTTLAATLDDIEKNLYSHKARKREYDEDDDHQSWILSTHPHTARRSMAIRRDAVGLPKYPELEKREKIPVPLPRQFKAVEAKHWGSNLVMGVVDNPTYYDCLWDEITPPESLVETYNQFQGDSSRDLDFHQVIGKPLEGIRSIEAIMRSADKDRPASKPLQFLPEEVNTWQEDDAEKIDEWWKQSLQLLDDSDGYADLMDEAMTYSPEVVKLILMRSCPEYSSLAETLAQHGSSDDDGVEDVDFQKVRAQEVILYLGMYRLASPELRAVTSILIKNIFEKDESLNSVEGFEKFCALLGSFYAEHGAYLAYDGARFFIRIEELFKAANESDRERLVELCQVYERELLGGVESSVALARTLMPETIQRIDQRSPGQFYGKFKIQKELSAENKAYQLPEEIGKAVKSPTLSSEVVRESLERVPKNFRPKNLTTTLYAVGKEYNRRIDDEGYSDMVMESNAEASAVLLEADEFENKYFGKDRLAYAKSPYILLDRNVLEYEDVASLWTKAGYGEAFNNMPAGQEKLHFLLETFRARSARRDVLIAQALDWQTIEFVEDIIKSQEEILKIDDISLLIELSNVFSNPLLSLAVSQKLWELYERDRDGFFAGVPEMELERVFGELNEFPQISQNKKLQAILLCYSEPTYVRDELLRPLVDAAPDEDSTMALASWYCEPPPGILRPRSGEVVAVTETILDILRGMPSIDKQELFLYFLGHRQFYSGIDSQFFRELKKYEEGFRKDAIFLGKAQFVQKHGLRKGEEEEEYIPHTDEYDEYDVEPAKKGAINPTYVVESPDSLVFLTKSSGIPIEILLNQQRLTTTRREQREFITHLLLDRDGLLLSGDKEEFLNATARNVVENSTWSQEQTEEESSAVIDLLSFALSHCPEQKLPDLFLSLWNLQQEKTSLPRIVTAMLREMGSLFVKAGQYLGTQTSALPKEWTQAFRELSDQNVRAEKTLVYEHEHAVYGEKSPFKAIGKKVGEGSMAAVYHAELKEGQNGDSREVAVKIFHPNIEDELEMDVKYLDQLVKFINERRKVFKVRLPNNLAEVSRNQILRELSFDNIVKNSQDMAEVLSRSTSSTEWRVPQIQRDQSRSGFIVYDYSPGVADDALPGDARSYLRSELAMELLRQILVEGTYQGDPNIGNFKVLLPKSGQQKAIVDWLDTDHVGRFNKVETKDLRDLVSAIVIKKSPKAVARLLSSFVDMSEKSDQGVLSGEVQAWLEEKDVLGESSVDKLEELLTSFLDFLAERKMVLREQHVTLLRTLGLMRPLLAEVDPKKLLPFFAKLMFTR